MLRLFLFIFLTIFYSLCSAKTPALFLFLGGDAASIDQKILANHCVSGAQIIYSWQKLEPRKGVYDFSKIETDLNFLNNLHKKLFIQIQDRSFSPTIFNVPEYIRNEPQYHGGVAMQYDFPGEGKPITAGWVARVWDPAVRERFKLLIQALAARFDGKIAGINLPETAVDVDANKPPTDFTADNYFYGELANLATLRDAFQKSVVMQYVNFFPNEWNNDQHYMERLFTYALQHQIALGGPDLLPNHVNQMKNSYPFFHRLQNQLLIGIAVQEPDYTYHNPQTNDYYHFADFYAFANNYLGAEMMFWNVQEPFFSTELVPELNSRHFRCSDA